MLPPSQGDRLPSLLACIVYCCSICLTVPRHLLVLTITSPPSRLALVAGPVARCPALITAARTRPVLFVRLQRVRAPLTQRLTSDEWPPSAPLPLVIDFPITKRMSRDRSTRPASMNTDLPSALWKRLREVPASPWTHRATMSGQYVPHDVIFRRRQWRGDEQLPSKAEMSCDRLQLSQHLFALRTASRAAHEHHLHVYNYTCAITLILGAVNPSRILTARLRPLRG